MQPIEAWAHAHLWTAMFTFSWLLLTLCLGLRAQWREVERLLGGGITQNTRTSVDEMACNGEEETPPAPRQDPDDGLWYAPTFDPQTGRRNGKRRVDAPSSPRLGSGANTARLGMFNR